MTRRGLLLTLAASALLAGCGGEPPAPFPPLAFDYLPKLHLNVATVDVETAPGFNAAPQGTPVDELAPEAPADLLRRMAEERLLPVGGGLADQPVQHLQVAVADPVLVDRHRRRHAHVHGRACVQGRNSDGAL